MKVELLKPPPPLSFFEGDDEFSLLVRPLKDTDRMDVVDGIGRMSYHDMSAALKEVVIGWKNVVGMDGNPIPFAYKDDHNRDVNRLGEFLAKLPLRKHLEVLAGLMGYMGFAAGQVKEFVSIAAGSTEFDPAPTSPPDATTQAPASGG